MDYWMMLPGSRCRGLGEISDSSSQTKGNRHLFKQNSKFCMTQKICMSSFAHWIQSPVRLANACPDEIHLKATSWKLISIHILTREPRFHLQHLRLVSKEKNIFPTMVTIGMRRGIRSGILKRVSIRKDGSQNFVFR